MNVLIVRTDRLGDMILTLPMARAIRRAMPSARVSFLISEYTKPIVALCPDVDAVVIARNGFGDLVRQFRTAKADVVFFPNPNFRFALAAFIARIPKRVSTAYRWYSLLFTGRISEHRRTAKRHEAEFNLRMLSYVGIPVEGSEQASIATNEGDREFVASWLTKNDVNNRFAVLHTSSGGSSKEWPRSKFDELADRLSKECGLGIVYTGLHKDTASGMLFVNHSLPQLAALLQQASLVLANSTGPGHLAAALNVPTVGLFPLPLALSKERWGFRGQYVKNLSPEPVPGCPNCKECTCMERLEVSLVMKEATELLGAQR
jgi:heptosyltransferase-3